MRRVRSGARPEIFFSCARSQFAKSHGIGDADVGAGQGEPLGVFPEGETADEDRDAGCDGADLGDRLGRFRDVAREGNRERESSWRALLDETDERLARDVGAERLGVPPGLASHVGEKADAEIVELARQASEDEAPGGSGTEPRRFRRSARGLG